MTCPLVSSPEGACQSCETCTFPGRLETEAERRAREEFPIGRFGFVLCPRPQGIDLVGLMATTDVVDGKVVRKTTAVTKEKGSRR